MVVVERATPSDRTEVEYLVAAYHASEGVAPQPGHIAWAVEQQLMGRFPGVLLIAREGASAVGVALAAYQPSAELGRILQVNDFFVEPEFRRRGVGRALATRVLAEAAAMGIDQVALEITPTNEVAALFWRSLGFQTAGRTVYSRAP